MVKRLFNSSSTLFTRQQSNILSASVIITASSLVSAVLGMVRNRVLVSQFFDTPAQLDAFWVAFRLPELAFQLLVVGTVSAALIPVLHTYSKKSKAEGMRVVSSVMNVVMTLFIIVSIVIFIFAVPFTRMITSHNFSEAQILLSAGLTRTMLIAQLFFAVSNFLSATIQAHKRFLIPALSPSLYNVGIIIGVLAFAPSMGIYGAAVGVVIGSFLHLIIQLPLVYQLGYRHHFRFELSHPGVRELLRLAPPRTLTIAVSQIELFVSVYFATALPSGSLTIINLSQQLMTAPTRIFAVPLGQASLPFLSKQVADTDMKGFAWTVHSSLQHIFFLAFPAAMLLLILRIPLVRLAYGTSTFPWPATLLTGKSVAILSIALFAQGGIHILVRAFYALHNTLLPFVVAMISVGVNVGLSFLGVYILNIGVLGLASAVSIATIVQFLLLLALLVRALDEWKLIDLVGPTLKIVMASVIMGIFLWLPMRLLDIVLDTTRVIPLIGLTVSVGVIGAFVYLGLAKFLHIPEYQAYTGLLRRLGNWKQVLTASGEVLETPSQSKETTSY